MSEPIRVLIVEDSEDDALLVLRQLQKAGYAPEHERVDTAETMRRALALRSWDLIISDYNLPSFDGLAALEIFQETGRDIPFILVSGAIGEATAVEAMKAGAHDCVMKDRLVRLAPAVERERREAQSRAECRQVEREVRRARREWEDIFQAISHPTFIIDPLFRVVAANRAAARVAGMTAAEMTRRKCYEVVHGGDSISPPEDCLLPGIIASGDSRTVEAEMEIFGRRYLVCCTPVFDDEGLVSRVIHIATDITERIESQNRLRRALGATVQSMATAVEIRDPYTAGHQRRTADLARKIAEEFGFDAGERDFIRIAASIHDIGKIAVPAEILSKPARLTDIEFALVKMHALQAYDILRSIEFGWPVAEVILQHHERLDGSGYPDGLKGTEILLGTRILSVADVVEAISSHRPYRPAHGVEAALDEIEKQRGVLYDADVVDACLASFRNKGYKFPA